MNKYIIERDMPGVGNKTGADLRGAAGHSNDALAAIGPGIQWLESFVTANKIFCVYLADDERKIQSHAQKSGFPASAVHQVKAILDPSSEAR
jgi:hypothetical protein